MPGEFQYEVFLSHSAKDKAVVRPLAERLAGDEERLVLLAMHQTLVGEGAGPRLIELDGNGHGQYPPGRERLFSGAKERCRFQ
jgi:hypothetical protein